MCWPTARTPSTSLFGPATVEWGLGAVLAPEPDGRRFLAGRTRGPLAVEASAVRGFLRLRDGPVQYGAQLHFCEELDTSVLG